MNFFVEIHQIFSYGYRGKDSRYNIRVLSNGEIVYFTAAVVVLFNPEQQTQRHYKGHNDDVKRFTFNQNFPFFIF